MIPLLTTSSPTLRDVGHSKFLLPEIITNAGEQTSQRFIEFFLVNIRNKNTRGAYAQAIRQFLSWCEVRGFELSEVSSLVIAAYAESHRGAPPTVNQHLAAIRSLFAWLVAGGVISKSPASEVRGIKHRVKQGKTPALSDDEMIELLGSIDVSHVVGQRDRALIATMFFTFARVSAVLNMKVSDYFQKGRRSWIRLYEKGGKVHEVPAHHTLEEHLDSYLEAAGLLKQKDAPLFQTTRGRSRRLTGTPLHRREAWAMVKRRVVQCGVNPQACNHTFRASGITNYLRNGGSRDNAQKIAAHEDSRTTALYDRRGDDISLDEIERIRL